jgi:hypothetical protein
VSLKFQWIDGIVGWVTHLTTLFVAHFDSSYESICDACTCAKAHQLPFPVSLSCSSAPLKLIFSDVRGPTIDSFGNKKYYVSFFDDYSKFTWIYLLLHKYEVSKYFLEFQKLVECLLERKIITVQLDWGGEYEGPHFYFRANGISHLVSCPHTHQQNGVVEHKRRHIVEMGLALLAPASMPLKYWDEAFLAATFLINHTPIKVLSYATPPTKTLWRHSRLYKFSRVRLCMLVQFAPIQYSQTPAPFHYMCFPWLQ